MAWQDRLQEATFTDPDGVEFRLDYEELRQSKDRRTKPFEFAGLDGAYGQDNGSGPNMFPRRFIIYGDDYDITAEAFFNALHKPGFSVYNDPLLGRFTVIPVGTVDRTDKIVREGNQALIDVVLMETLTEIFPTSEIDGPTATTNFADEAGAAAAADFANGVGTLNEAGRQRVVSVVRNALGPIRDNLSSLAESSAQVQQVFTDILDSLELTVDTLIDTPLQLAGQMYNCIRVTSNGIGTLGDRMDAYSNLVGDLLGQSSGTSTENNVGLVMFARAATSAISVSATQGGAVSRQDATNNALAIAAVQDSVTAYTESLDLQADNDAYTNLLLATRSAQGLLVKTAGFLPVERTITLTGPRNVLEFLVEIYGDLTTAEEKLDDFIVRNDINGIGGDNLLILPAGITLTYIV